ncbi:MAG: hypothetical protein AABW54_03875 [Candidatus Micrarchaeota archaeon]
MPLSAELSMDEIAARVMRPARSRQATLSAAEDIRKQVLRKPTEQLFEPRGTRPPAAAFDEAWFEDGTLFSFLSWANASHRRLQSIEWLAEGSFKFGYSMLYAGVPLERSAVLCDSHKAVNLGGLLGFASGASVRRSLKNLFENNGLAPGSVLGKASIPPFHHAAARRRITHRTSLPLAVGRCEATYAVGGQ